MADYSADCNPAVFNRLARYLRNQSKPAPGAGRFADAQVSAA
jgi:hypothetical protein